MTIIFLLLLLKLKFILELDDSSSEVWNLNTDILQRIP